MSRTATRSRFSLLASSSFIAANILAGASALMATSFAPSVALTGRYINEFDGDNTMVFISPGPSNLQLIDSLNGGFGEVTLGTNMFATGGHLSAFANASIRFQSDYQATSVTAGFRYQW